MSRIIDVRLISHSTHMLSSLMASHVVIPSETLATVVANPTDGRKFYRLRPHSVRLPDMSSFLFLIRKV